MISPEGIDPLVISFTALIGYVVIGMLSYRLGYDEGEGAGHDNTTYDKLQLAKMKYALSDSNVEFFDKKVDIVCNACGLVGEFECAFCSLVIEE